ETTTADLSLSYRTYGYGDFEGNVDYECPTPSGSLVVFAGVCVGICLCGLVGNGIVMWSLGFHIKQNPFNIYILNLAVSDFSLLLMFFLLLLAVLMPVAFCLHSFISFYRDFVF
ncbi:MRGRD protein, partial [Baryphthengus martii]|nr:MRGRD protein [Baryphthengus martii]